VTTTIHKHSIPSQRVWYTWPEEFNILALQVQDDIPHMWIEFPTDYQKVRRVEFTVRVTGGQWEPGETDVYIGTYQHDWFVGHVYMTFIGEPQQQGSNT
jgi:hypothetical protein